MNIFGSNPMRAIYMILMIGYPMFVFLEMPMITELSSRSLLSERQLTLVVFACFSQYPIFGVLGMCFPDPAIILYILYNIAAAILSYQGWRRIKRYTDEHR